MDRTSQVETLRGALRELVEVLSLDPQCQWRDHFECCLLHATELAHDVSRQDEASSLSCSVMSVYCGMGSFNDYAPYRNGQVIAGMEEIDRLSSNVFQSALSLRVIES